MTKEAQALIANGVKPDRIVYINRNGPDSTLGVYFDTFEQFVCGIRHKIHLLGTFPVEDYELENLAADGDDLETMKSLLADMWRAEGTWDDYVEERRRSNLANVTTGI